MIRINDIIDKMVEDNPEADIDLVERAYVYSARVHQGQMRLSGEPYLTHPMEVAGILTDMRLDPESVAAGLLHDVIEDTKATPEEIDEMFGKEVRHIVSGVTKLSTLPFGSKQARQAESIRKMLLAMVEDVRVVLVKLADRLHNMRTLKALPQQAALLAWMADQGKIHLAIRAPDDDTALDPSSVDKVTLDNIDTIVELIKKAPNPAEAKKGLVKKFSLS